jgi:DNA primase large subunit
LSIFASTISSYAEEEIEDFIDIAESKSKIIAIIEGRKTITFDLRSNEKVLWSGSKGYLGSFLTDTRFFVISTSLNAWQVMPLRSEESGEGVASLSEYIALLVTKDRAIGFDATSNRFIETRLPIRDELLAAEAEKYVAVVITSSRAFGLAAKASAFIEITLRIRETIESIKLTSSKATVRTSDRLLTFEATGLTWNEHRLY